jgi:hypothetical protein
MPHGELHGVNRLAALDRRRGFVHTEAMPNRDFRRRLELWLTVLSLVPGAAAQSSGLGIFDAHQDIGALLTPGAAAFVLAGRPSPLYLSGRMA